jgi:DNA-binding response OmpR family regulator
MEKLVFIIDDDQVYLNFMKNHFRQMEGYSVETFPDGETALQQLSTKNPVLIILDHNLNGTEKDGLYYLKRIRRVKPGVPMVYITASTDARVKQQSLKAGAAAHIIKSDAFLVQLRTALDEISAAKKGFFAKLFK